MKEFGKNNLLFLLHFGVWFGALAVALCVVDKASLHFALNTYHTNWLDTILPPYSALVNWLPYATIVLLLFWKAGYAAFLAAAQILSTIITQIIKHCVGAPRPSSWFAQEGIDISSIIVDGVHLHCCNSFPSGHTTTFFALFFGLCVLMLWEKKDLSLWTKGLIQTLCFYFALIGAYSRIYMSQHFALDIEVGGWIAVLSVAVVYWLFFVRYRLNEQKWFQWRVIRKSV